MNMGQLKKRLGEGEKFVGAVMLLPSPDVAEILSLSGLGLVMIDHEHGGGGLSDFVAQSRAMQSGTMEYMVRVPHHDFTYAARLLDAGARAIVCPSIDTPDQAEEFVNACRYPLRGKRGAGAGLRAARYGLDADYYTPAGEDRTLLVAQIESAQAVENIDEICSVAGIDMLLIGPRDLSASIGKLNNFDDAELRGLLQRAEERILASGKFLASTLQQDRSVPEMFAAGYSVVLAGKDVDFLLDGAKALAAMA